MPAPKITAWRILTNLENSLRFLEKVAAKPLRKVKLRGRAEARFEVSFAYRLDVARDPPAGMEKPARPVLGDIVRRVLSRRRLFLSCSRAGAASSHATGVVKAFAY
jgi:hypothetical protein